MKKEMIRIVFGCTLSLIVSSAFAQGHQTGGNSGGGNSGGSSTNTRSSGGSAGGGGGHASSTGSGVVTGGSGGYRGGGYQGGATSGSRSTGSSGYGSRQSGAGGSTTTNGGYSSRYGQGSTTRGQSRSGPDTVSRSGGYNGRHSGSRSQGGAGTATNPTRSGGYNGRSGSVGNILGGNRVTSGASQGFDRGHSDLSRNGRVTYTGNNNRYGANHALDGESKFGAAHRGRIDSSVLGKVIGGNRIGLVHGGWRTGYYGYWGGWRDSFFAYPFYMFDPWLGPCYCSPWYYYPCLPAYIAAPRVVIVDSYPSTNWSGDDYEWQQPSAQNSNPMLDDSIQDLVTAFESQDHKIIDRVTPHSGNVNIYADGKYSYSLNANDFYDTYVDGIESTKTDRYQVIEVKASKDGSTARVTAKHVYNDPWGNRTYVYHSYFLVKEGEQYVIREFGTSDYRTGY